MYDDPAITQKSSAIAKLLLDGVCTYVNLMSEEETASLITNYQEELMMKAREIRTIYVRREKAKKTAYLAVSIPWGELHAASLSHASIPSTAAEKKRL